VRTPEFEEEVMDRLEDAPTTNLRAIAQGSILITALFGSGGNNSQHSWSVGKNTAILSSFFLPIMYWCWRPKFWTLAL